MFELPPKIDLAQKSTPLHLLPRISQKYGGPRIWIKRDDLTGSVLSGNKVRKLEYVLHEVQRDNLDVLITCGGWNSNHCRATAFVAAQLGLKAHLILRDDGGFKSDGNYLLDKISGAAISVYDEKRYFAELNSLFETWQKHYAERGLKSRLIPTGGSDATGVIGYYAASLEMSSQFETLGLEPGYIVCASGSGGTQAGLTLGFSLLQSSAQVIGIAVCDSSRYFDNKVVADVSQWQKQYAPQLDAAQLLKNLRPLTLEAYIGPGYAKAYPEVIRTIQELASEEGVLLDPTYTGKAFWGLLSEIKLGRFDGVEDVVFVHTGGSFGLFPYRDMFL